MDKALIDIPVAMVFFNRPEPLKECFAAVRNVKPTKLFLIQDGPRQNNLSDLENIQKCRDVVSNIDWECEVRQIYSDENLGCGKRIYSGIKEAFSYVDRLVILEDDIVASKDFFTFCAEMLEKYKDDKRIIDIAGMNHCGITERCPYSYFFSEIGSCWGWATWKRSWELMQYELDFLEDKYAIDCFLNSIYKTKSERKRIIKDAKQRKEILDSGRRLSAWTFQFKMAGYFNSTLSIVPQKNLISNIGLTGDSSHASGSINKIPKGLQKVFFAKTYPLEFPLKHPKYIIEDNQYAKEVYKILGLTLFLKVTRRIEGVIRRIVFAEKGDIKKLFKRLFEKNKFKMSV